MDTKTAFIYLRASSSKQDKSVNQQRKICFDYAEAHNIAIIDSFEDDGVSAWSGKERKGFNNLITACKRGGAEYVLMWSIDRFSRQYKEGMIELLTLEVAGVELMDTLQGTYDSNDIGGAIKQLVGLFTAEEYSSKISANVKRGLNDAKDRQQPHGYAPQGYKIEHDQDGHNIWVEDEATSPAVKKIYQWYFEGTRPTVILKKLLDEGYKTKKGAPWSTSTLFGVMKNPAFGGYQSKSKKEKDRLILSKMNIETYIKPEVWEYVFYSNHNKRISRPAKIRHNPLTGLIKCPNCRTNLHSVNGNSKYARYKCGLVRNHVCDWKFSVSLPYLEEEMLRFWNQMVKKEGLKRIAKRVSQLELEKRKKTQESIQPLLDKETELKVRISKVEFSIELAEMDNIPKMMKRMNSLEAELKEVRFQISNSDVDFDPMSVDEALEAIKDVLQKQTDIRLVAPFIDGMFVTGQDEVSLTVFGEEYTLSVPNNLNK